MRDAAGRSRGFAFLTFEDAAAVNAVMVREHFLDGKVVSIHDINGAVLPHSSSMPDSVVLLLIYHYVAIDRP